MGSGQVHSAAGSHHGFFNGDRSPRTAGGPEAIVENGFVSRRAGLIRTALRADQQTHDIAAHTDLRSLGSVTRHLRREHLLSRSVAGQLGL